MGKKEAKIWILRVYELDEPKYVRRSTGMLYANVDTPIKPEGKPVLSDNEFAKLKDDIIIVFYENNITYNLQILLS